MTPGHNPRHETEIHDRTQLIATDESFTVRSGVFRVTPDGLESPRLVRPADELVLLVHVLPRSRSPSEDHLRTFVRPDADVTIELWRGNTLRDRVVQPLSTTPVQPVSLAHRLHWSDRPNASSRLRCRVLVGGRPISQFEILLGQPAVDAQGRFGAPDERLPTQATLVAYVQELEARLSLRP